MYEKADYNLTHLDEIKLTPDELVSGEFDGELLDRMKKIILTESPIRESLLFKRTLNSIGLKKATERIRAKLEEIASSLEIEKEAENGELVYFSNRSNTFRPTPESEIRYSYQIPYYEGANCILYIVENGEKSLYTKKELKKLFMNEMGYLKMGKKVLDLFNGSVKDKRIKTNRAGRIIK